MPNSRMPICPAAGGCWGQLLSVQNERQLMPGKAVAIHGWLGQLYKSFKPGCWGQLLSVQNEGQLMTGKAVAIHGWLGQLYKSFKPGCLGQLLSVQNQGQLLCCRGQLLSIFFIKQNYKNLCVRYTTC